MIKHKGFTLVELVIFVVILAIVSSTLMFTTSVMLRYTPIEHNLTEASAISTKCAEYLLGQRYINDFEFNGQSCPGGAVYNATPSFCNTPASDFLTSVKIECTTVNGSSAYKLITVDTSLVETSRGAGGSILKLLISDY